MNLKELRRLIHNRFPEISSMFYIYKMRKYYKNLKTDNLFIGTEEMINNNFDTEVSQVIAEKINCADVFVDVGANFGYYSFGLGIIKSIAIEPHPESVKILMENCKHSEIIPMALSNKPKIVTLYGWGTGASTKDKWMKNPAYSIKVPATTLDIIIADRFLDMRVVIKIDAEGAEEEILYGSQQTINRSLKPIWIIESNNVEEIMYMFKDYKHTKINETNHLFEPLI